MLIRRCEENPIVVPGRPKWRRVATFNPGVILEGGTFYMYERCAGSLRPFKTSIGILKSTDGVHFELASQEPILTGDMFNLPGASIEDARVVRIDGTYYLSYALQPHEFDCWPSGTGVPDYQTYRYEGWHDYPRPMITQSGIAVSKDPVHFEHLCFTSPREIDDRDHALFPEKINGEFVLLRRPMEWVGEKFGTQQPGIWIATSPDLKSWSEPKLLAVAENDWEGGKIGAAASPVRTDEGWLLLYHGVDGTSTYRVGAMLLDLEKPTSVLARTSDFIMEPEEYYERFGLVIPNVVFPTAVVVKDDELLIYYGCCDTSIALATVGVDELVAHIKK
ncbi:MAG: glycosidase [Chitinivibrionales bacterium]|nr:glycosidase [Chitinivibrionales bacterium]MBD3396005.1 glycosidase [Chitinivibrionales bacterium]